MHSTIVNAVVREWKEERNRELSDRLRQAGVPLIPFDTACNTMLQSCRINNERNTRLSIYTDRTAITNTQTGSNFGAFIPLLVDADSNACLVHDTQCNIIEGVQKRIDSELKENPDVAIQILIRTVYLSGWEENGFRHFYDAETAKSALLINDPLYSAIAFTCHFPSGHQLPPQPINAYENYFGMTREYVSEYIGK